MEESIMKKHRIYTTSFARVYPLYIAKVERKGRTKPEVDEFFWLTGYSQKKWHITPNVTFFHHLSSFDLTSQTSSGVL